LSRDLKKNGGLGGRGDWKKKLGAPIIFPIRKNILSMKPKTGISNCLFVPGGPAKRGSPSKIFCCPHCRRQRGGKPSGGGGAGNRTRALPSMGARRDKGDPKQRSGRGWVSFQPAAGRQKNQKTQGGGPSTRGGGTFLPHPRLFWGTFGASGKGIIRRWIFGYGLEWGGGWVKMFQGGGEKVSTGKE